MLIGLGIAMPRENTRQHRLLGLGLAAACTGFAVDSLFGFNARVPVSAGLLAVLMAMAGSLTHLRPIGPRAARLLAVLLLVAGLAAALLQTARYTSARHLQAARGAMFYAQQAREQGNEALARQYAQAAETLLEGAPEVYDYRIGLARAEAETFRGSGLEREGFWYAQRSAPNTGN